MKNKNLVFFLEKHKRPLAKVINLKLPSPNPYHVLVKIYYSGICGSQIKEIDGKRGFDKYLPHLLGHEGYGKIVEIGKNVKKLKKGDYVLLSWIKGKGREEKNLVIKNQNLKINSGPISTFSFYSLISENRCFKINTNLVKKFIPILGCSLPTGIGLIYKNLKPNLKKTYIISGFGAVGIFSYIAINFFKPKKIIVIENNLKKIKILKKIDKNIEIINFSKSKKKLVDKILLVNNGELADYVIDCSGNIKAMNNCISYIKNNGKFIFASHPDHKKKLYIDPHELIKGKKIMSSWGGGFNLDKDLKTLIFFYKKFFLKSKIKKLIKFYTLNNINFAINDVKKGNVFKVLLKHF